MRIMPRHLRLSDDGYIGLQSVSLLNFRGEMGAHGDDPYASSHGKDEDAVFLVKGRYHLPR